MRSMVCLAATSKGLDDLAPVREYPRIAKPMSLEAGMKIMAHRLNLTGAEIRRLARDRYPTTHVKHEQTNLKKFHLRCFLQSDIVFSDILHVDYDELHYLGIGRRYLINRILRSILSGICDRFDPSGRSGDFCPRSWMTEDQALRIRKIQCACIRLMKEDNAKLLQSTKVRLRRISTDILKVLVDNSDKIRKEVRMATFRDSRSGLNRFSSMLTDFKRNFYRRTRKEDIHNREKARKKTIYGKMHSKRIVRRQRYQRGSCILIRGLTDLRKILDPSVPSWYRRPTDSDWYEGVRSERRKPRLPNKKALLARYGLGCVPGLTESISATDWKSIRTVWKTAEVRKLFEEKRRIDRDAVQ